MKKIFQQKTKREIILIGLVVFLFLFLLKLPVQAAGPCSNLVPCKDNCTLNDLFLMLHNIVDCLVYLATIICLLFIVIGGLLYIFSLGNPEMCAKAKNTILWAIGGLALVFLAWLIINTIMVAMGVQGSFLMWWG